MPYLRYFYHTLSFYLRSLEDKKYFLYYSHILFLPRGLLSHGIPLSGLFGTVTSPLYISQHTMAYHYIHIYHCQPLQYLAVPLVLIYMFHLLCKYDYPYQSVLFCKYLFSGSIIHYGIPYITL